jgi:hypothetical protein
LPVCAMIAELQRRGIARAVGRNLFT